MVEAPNAKVRFGTGETNQILSRLLSSMSAATFEMETFTKLAGIVATRNIPTAAMECINRPRLLINPDFVEKHCKRDEHLFLLVMHELWHVMLAHTNLYPRITKAQNIAFDAIINAGLSRQFYQPEYCGFFESINPADQFPHLLLRPPSGWHHDPQYPDIGPEGTKRVLKLLYPPMTAKGFDHRMPFYQEILDLIKQDMEERGEFADGIPVLLGDHESDDDGGMVDEYLQDVMGKLMEQWPQKPPGMEDAGQGAGKLVEQQMPIKQSSHDARRVFANVLRKCLGKNPGPYERRIRAEIPGIAGTNVLPNARDRLMHARRMLGTPGTLWNQPGTVKARVQQPRHRAHIYLDVSGSMGQIVPQLLGLILPYVASGKAELYQFSTKVEALSLKKLREGRLKTTGGTSIRCVIDHLLKEAPTVKRALILTDGRTGRPRLDQTRQLESKKLRFHVVLPAESPYERDLKSIATSFTILPPLGR